MSRLRVGVGAAVLVLVATPVVDARWYSLGSFEPDTRHDAEGGWMWPEPDDDPRDSVRQVYFNGLIAGVNSFLVNPNTVSLPPVFNVGPLGTRVMPPVARLVVYFGVWKDCNQDGYIGFGAGALTVYPAMFANESVCPPGFRFNRGAEVHEFLPIVRDTLDLPASDVIVDPEAMVWADRLAPGEEVERLPSLRTIDPSLPENSHPHRETDYVFQIELPALGLEEVPIWVEDKKSAYPREPDPILLDMATLGPEVATYVTFYARVGLATTSYARLSPTDAVGTYGAEWCHGDTQNVILGFDCDPSRWWDRSHGASQGPPAWGDPRPGTFYHLRDVDCYDQSVVEGVRPTVVMPDPDCPE